MAERKIDTERTKKLASRLLAYGEKKSSRKGFYERTDDSILTSLQVDYCKDFVDEGRCDTAYPLNEPDNYFVSFLKYKIDDDDACGYDLTFSPQGVEIKTKYLSYTQKVEGVRFS
jgi:hypothetical protein